MSVSELKELGISEVELHSEWADQVKQQTKLLARKLSNQLLTLCRIYGLYSGRSKNLGRKAIEEVQTLQLTLNSYISTVAELEGKLTNDDSDDLVNIAMALQNAQDKAKQVTNILARKRKALGVDGRLSLKTLSSSRFLQLRMSARALKSRIRDRLRQRKFELSLLERAYRHGSSGEFQTFGSLHTALTASQRVNSKAIQRVKSNAEHLLLLTL
jgi:hypothetical protein